MSVLSARTANVRAWQARWFASGACSIGLMAVEAMEGRCVCESSGDAGEEADIIYRKMWEMGRESSSIRGLSWKP